MVVEAVLSKVEEPEVTVATISEVVMAVAKRVELPVVDPALSVRGSVVTGRRPLPAPDPEPEVEALSVEVTVSVPVTEVLVTREVAVAEAVDRTAAIEVSIIHIERCANSCKHDWRVGIEYSQAQ